MIKELIHLWTKHIQKGARILGLLQWELQMYTVAEKRQACLKTNSWGSKQSFLMLKIIWFAYSFVFEKTARPFTNKLEKQRRVPSVESTKRPCMNYSIFTLKRY